MTLDNNTKQIIEEMTLLFNWTENTKKLYNIALKDYSKYHNKTFTELIEEAETDEENIRKTGKRTIKRRLITYQLYLQTEKQFTPNSIKAYLTKICKIYRYLDITIPTLPTIRTNHEETFTDIPTFKEIQQAIFHSTPKMKALISFIASSGLRRSDVANITVNDFIEATKEYHQKEFNTVIEFINVLKHEEIIVPTWYLTDIKTGIHHITYSSNESTRYIIQMLQERLHKEDLNKDTLLFGIQASTITRNFKNLNNKLGMGNKSTRVYFHPHALRKYFATTLTSNDMDYLATEFLLGHKLRGSSSSYYFANPRKLKNKYVRVMDNLNFTMNINYVDGDTAQKQELRKMKRMYEEKTKSLEAEMEALKQYVRDRERVRLIESELMGE